jgi:outer membrane protein
MKIILGLFVAIFMATFFPSLSAQKFGHVNSAQLIEVHPKVSEAAGELEIFRKSMVEPFEAKAKSFESKYLFFLEEVNAGTLSKVSAQTRQQELLKEQQALNTEEQQIQFAIYQKREQLLQPILADVDSLIQTIGKESAYTMIFDTSVAGALLFANESEDLTETVKGRMKE